MTYHVADLFLFSVIHVKDLGGQILSRLLQGPEFHSERLLDFMRVALIPSLVDSRVPHGDKISLGELLADEINNLELDRISGGQTSWLLYCPPTTVNLSFPALELSMATTWAMAISRTSTNNGVWASGTSASLPEEIIFQSCELDSFNSFKEGGSCIGGP